jgi:hypothetical protein
MRCVPWVPTPVLIGYRDADSRDADGGRFSRHYVTRNGPKPERTEDTFAKGYRVRLLTGKAMLEINHLESGTRECRPESMFSGVEDRLADDFSVWNEAGNPIISLADVTKQYCRSDHFG